MSNMRRLAAALVAVAFLAACGSTGSQPPVERLSLELTSSTTNFGLALLDRLLIEQDAGNVFISPLSATLALSMAASAAQGDTRAAMLRVLGFDPSTDPSGQARQTIDRLNRSDPSAQLALAQAAWAQKGLALSPSYVAKLQNDYRAELSSLDFGDPGAAGVVNRWVDEKTRHKITKLVDGFDPSTVGVLVNATYFHALWATEFKPLNTPVVFHRFSGVGATPPMMHRDEDVTEFRTPSYVAELLPYKGGRFSAVLILPPAALSPAEFAAFLTPALWQQALGAFHDATGPTFTDKCKAAGQGDSMVLCDGTLQMPKFTLDYRKDLTGSLQALGMPVPGAQLPEFCAGCAITGVVQATRLEVDEKGTTAAAATGVVVGTALRLPTVVDRPFAFAILDNATDAPLFIGAIGNLG